MKSAVVLLALLSVGAWGEAPNPAAAREFDSPCAYPEAALAAQKSGSTEVSFTGTSSGQIEDVKMVHSSGHTDLDEAAVQCVGRWRYDPDSAAGKFIRGDHKLNIYWNPADKQQAGRSIGLPHACQQAYPLEEAIAGIGGTTTLRFTITEEGRVSDIAVAQSSGNANLDAASMACARLWRYRPAIDNDKPVAVPWKAEIKWIAPEPVVPDFAETPPDCLHAYPLKPEDLARTTELTFTIVHGNVEDVQITHPSGNEALDRTAVACVLKRHYVRVTVTVKGEKQDLYSTKMPERFVWADAAKPSK